MLCYCIGDLFVDSATVVRVVNSSNTVNEGGSFNVTCETDGYPEPNVTWIKVDSGQRFNGNTLNFTNINRNDGGQYRCEAVNVCGNDSRLQQIEVYCKYIIRRTIFVGSVGVTVVYRAPETLQAYKHTH